MPRKSLTKDETTAKVNISEKSKNIKKSTPKSPTKDTKQGARK